jgi:hypothetical protein
LSKSNWPRALHEGKETAKDRIRNTPQVRSWQHAAANQNELTNPKASAATIITVISACARIASFLVSWACGDCGVRLGGHQKEEEKEHKHGDQSNIGFILS